MKKKLLLILLLCICLFISGCKKEEENKRPMVGGWELITNNIPQMTTPEIENIFMQAIVKYDDLELEMVGLLAEQVVQGKNYMFLTKAAKRDNPTPSFKIAIIYNDLDGNSTVTKVTDFDILKYVDNSIPNTSEELMGGWTVSMPSEPTFIEPDVQEKFEQAISKVQGKEYYPISTIAKQVVSGTNYLVLCYGREDNGKTGIYLLTLYEDLEGNRDIKTESYVDLLEFNQ